MIKRMLVRGIRKSAHLSGRVFSTGANLSGKVEDKAHRIINGLDNTIKLQDKVLFEQLYYGVIPYVTPIHPALPKAGRPGRITILIPSLQKSSFFGGTATALIFAAIAAEQKKMPLMIVETLAPGHLEEDELKKFLTSSDISFNQPIELMDVSSRRYNVYGYIDLHPDDIFIVSAWWDAHLLEQMPMIRKFIYLIQDYEPIFYNNGDMKVLAESSYHSSDFVPVCNTALMLKFMAQKGYKRIADDGLHFEPAVNMSKKVEVADRSPRQIKKKLFLYGRPSVERNLFYTALKAIDEIFTEQLLNPVEWECYMAGQDGLNNILLESGQVVQSMGKLSLEDYYEFGRHIDLGVSLMVAPHPSYPPLELSSMGAAVVTTIYETKIDLDMYNNNLLLAEPNIDAIKQKIVQAAAMPRDVRQKNALDTKLPTDWESALATTVKAALKKAA